MTRLAHHPRQVKENTGPVTTSAPYWATRTRGLIRLGCRLEKSANLKPENYNSLGNQDRVEVVEGGPLGATRFISDLQPHTKAAKHYTKT